jgi:hypothetical protein
MRGTSASRVSESCRSLRQPYTESKAAINPTSPAQYLAAQLRFPCKAAVLGKPPSFDSEPDFVGYNRRFLREMPALSD